MIRHGSSHALVTLAGLVYGPLFSSWLQTLSPAIKLFFVYVSNGLYALTGLSVLPDHLAYGFMSAGLAFLWGVLFHQLFVCSHRTINNNE